jgi:purine-binding chemotaxis protein CheW
MDDTFASQELIQKNVNHQHSSDEPCEYLAFRLGAEDYGIQIHCVQEIRSFEQPTHIATAPDYILGVRNLRGVIVPIVDMRVKFGKSAPIYDAQTVTIVLAVGNRVIGMVVDSVSDVVELAREQIKAAPEIGGELSTDYITGIGSIEHSQGQDNRMLVLLDIEKFMRAFDC